MNRVRLRDLVESAETLVCSMSFGLMISAHSDSLYVFPAQLLSSPPLLPFFILREDSQAVLKVLGATPHHS